MPVKFTKYFFNNTSDEKYSYMRTSFYEDLLISNFETIFHEKNGEYKIVCDASIRPWVSKYVVPTPLTSPIRQTFVTLVGLLDYDAKKNTFNMKVEYISWDRN